MRPGVNHQERRDWRVRAIAWEVGSGVEVAIASRVFGRPEVWMTVARPTRVGPAPEPPYFYAAGSAELWRPFLARY